MGQRDKPRASCLVGFRERHFKVFKSLDHNLRNNQTRIVLVVGRNNIPRNVLCAGCTKTLLVSRHVLGPEFPFFDIRQTEFPVLFRFVYPLNEAPALLLLREVQEELDDAGSVGVQVPLQIDD